MCSGALLDIAQPRAVFFNGQVVWTTHDLVEMVEA
jgi:hypothetical protein